MVETAPGLGDGGCVGQHADGAVDGSELAAWHAHGFLVVDADLETGRAPFDKVEGGLRFEGGDGGVAVAGDDVAAVEEGHGHVFSVAGIADDHLVVWFEACIHVRV